MSGIIGTLAGAPQQASTYGNYYQTAANEIATQYGSPEAQMFGKEMMGSLRPQFQDEQNQLGAAMAAQGITNSGAARAAYGNLGAGQAAATAGAIAPLYQQAESQYGNVIGEMPGAEVSGYQNALTEFYQNLNDAMSAFGMQGGTPSFNGPMTSYTPSWGSSDPANYYPSTSGAASAMEGAIPPTAPMP